MFLGLLRFCMFIVGFHVKDKTISVSSSQKDKVEKLMSWNIITGYCQFQYFTFKLSLRLGDMNKTLDWWRNTPAVLSMVLLTLSI